MKKILSLLIMPIIFIAFTGVVGAANPCGMKNPCAANPCGAKNPCMMKNPCAPGNVCNPCGASNPPLRKKALKSNRKAVKDG